MTPAVLVTDLVKRYGPHEAVAGLHLEAPAGALTALLGPNGAGKTTTVECCVGLRRPDAGTVRVLGRDPLRDARTLRPRVGVMLQDGGLPATTPAGRVLEHLAAMYATPRDTATLSERLGLDAFACIPVRRLSGGQRQRLALACAVVGRPELVFLDEPSAGMDPQARLAVWDLVRELRAEGTSIVLTTHQMSEAEALADHVVVMDHGRVLVAGTLADVVGESAALRVTLGPDVDPHTTAAALAAALGREVTPSPGYVVVHGEASPDLMHRVTTWALETGTAITALGPGRRALEDVFLELTGRELR